MAHILVVDDEYGLVWAVQRSLHDEGYQVSCAYDGVQALALARQAHPDLIILDIVMPRMNGLDVCHNVRQDTSLDYIPILFLTVRNAVVDRVYGLDSGCDDYLIKPFDLSELKARIRALLRRKRIASADKVQGEAEQDVLLRLPPLSLDLHTHQLHLRGKVIQLTQIEFNLLHYLMCHPAEIFSSEQLLQQVWGYSWGMANPSLVRRHIRNLRAKIEPDPTQPQYIRTIASQGYLLAL